MSKEYFHAAYGMIVILDKGGKQKDGTNRMCEIAHFIDHIFSTPDADTQKKLETHDQYKKTFWIKGEEPDACKPKKGAASKPKEVDNIQSKIEKQAKIQRGIEAQKKLENEKKEEKKDVTKT